MSHLTRSPGAVNTTFEPPAAAQWAEALSKNESLDLLASSLRPIANFVTKSDQVRTALRSRLLGHALHPLLTDLPIGFWTSALTLDVLSPHRGESASQCLTGLGILAAVPTAATGIAEWSDTEKEDARIGVVHALSNSAALTAFTASYFARRSGRLGWGRALGFLGGAAMAVGGYLGGHLAISRKVGSHLPITD